jgi:hypothetical protein
MTMLTDWDYNKVQDFDTFIELWETSGKDISEEIGEALQNKLGLPMCVLSAEQSKFFKRHYNTSRHNLGPLVKEIDVIRKLEGW